MSDKRVNLKIITPTGLIYDGAVDMVIMRTVVGDAGILAGHQPMVTILDYGVLKILSDGKEMDRAAVLGGYAEVGDDTVSILTDAAEWQKDIDQIRAERALKRAQERIASHKDKVDRMRAELALRRAMIRLHIKEL